MTKVDLNAAMLAAREAAQTKAAQTCNEHGLAPDSAVMAAGYALLSGGTELLLGYMPGSEVARILREQADAAELRKEERMHDA